jgi:hypothetical protein
MASMENVGHRRSPGGLSCSSGRPWFGCCRPPEHHRRSVRSCGSADDQYGAAVTLNDLATLHRALGRHEEAVRLHRRALAIAERLGALRLAGFVRRDLAGTLAASGDAGVARDAVR